MSFNNSPSSTRLKILKYLLTNCTKEDQEFGCSIKDIVNEFDLSPTSVRQYLNELEKDQLVIRKDKKGKTGRPAMVYSLHENALNLFPKAYADFSIRLINKLITKYGESIVHEILVDIGTEWAKDMKSNFLLSQQKTGYSSSTLDDNIDLTMKIFSEYGKFPELIEKDSAYILKCHNCLIFDIVQKQPLACSVDEALIVELAGQEIEKINCLSDNNSACIYQIQKEVEA